MSAGVGGVTIPIVRITLVGASNAGKTRLVDSFINSPAYRSSECDSWPHPPTSRPDLYHRVVTVEGFDDSTALSSLVIEIEDTPGSSIMVLRDRADAEPTMTIGDESRKGVSEFDRLRLRDGVNRYLDMTRKAPPIVLPEQTMSVPFAIFTHPTLGSRFTRSTTLWPLAQGRMALFLVYDATDKRSMREALELHQLLKIRTSPVVPLVFIVGNKQDLTGAYEQLDEEDAIRTALESYIAQHELQHFQMSAATGAGVYQAFVEAAIQVAHNPSLSAFEVEVAGPKTTNSSSEEESGTEAAG